MQPKRTLASIALLVSYALFGPILARADTITTFLVSGTAENDIGANLDSCAAFATCAFSGTFQVDVTTGAIVSSSVDITFPGLSAFDTLVSSEFYSYVYWIIQAKDSSNAGASLVFTTTSGSLVGFEGGMILDAGVAVFGGPLPAYINGTGSITPIPQPSSLALLALGLLPCLSFEFARRRALKHP